MKELEADSIDTVICDPPYGLSFMSKSWDSFPENTRLQEWTKTWATEALKVAKPGAFMLCFQIQIMFQYQSISRKRRYYQENCEISSKEEGN